VKTAEENLRIDIDASGLAMATLEERSYFRELLQNLLLGPEDNSYALAAWPEKVCGDHLSFLSPLPREAYRKLGRTPECPGSSGAVLYDPLGLAGRAVPADRAACPLVTTFLGSEGRHWPPSRSGFTLRTASRIITFTRSAFSYLVHRRGISASRVRWLPPGLWPQSPWEPSSRRFPLPREPYAVAVIATAAFKSLLQVIQASRIYRRHADKPLRLLVLGKPPLLFRPLARWRGPVPDLDFAGETGDSERARIVASAEALLLPGAGDLVWLSAAHALRHGVPIVAARGAPAVEILGDSALYFSPGNAREMAMELLRCTWYKGLARTLSQRAVTRAQAFSWGAFIAGLLDLFSEVAAEAAAPRAAGVPS
jgi:glycosyltransferase involved in cell wall biosynthesis